MARHPHVVRDAEVVAVDLEHGRRFGYRRRQLGKAAGGRMLGCSLFEIAPGRRPFPYHWHTANEEALCVLSGRGTLRLAGEQVPIGPGDYVACPTGPGGAHQVIITGDAPLRFLCVSEMIAPEVVVQPDSGKIGVIAGTPPGGEKGPRSTSAFFRKQDSREFDLEGF